MWVPDQLEYSTKVCSKCGEEKHTTCFYKNAQSKDGLTTVCKDCRNIQNKEYAERNKESISEYKSEWKRKNPYRKDDKARDSYLKRKYGISLEQYYELLEKQNGCCAVCERHEDVFKTRLAVDHSHKTGRVRGLLCTACNYRLVAKHEDGNLLRKIADYIEGGTEWFVPESMVKPKRRRKKKIKVDK